MHVRTTYKVRTCSCFWRIEVDSKGRTGDLGVIICCLPLLPCYGARIIQVMMLERIGLASSFLRAHQTFM